MSEKVIKFLLESVLLAIGMGIVSTAVWAVGALVIRRRKNRQDFEVLGGRFRQRGKYAVSAGKPERELTIEVAGNVLSVRFTVLPAGEELQGEIAMSEAFRSSGAGHYLHHKKGADLWGFWTLKVKDKNTLMLHTEYANERSELVSQGYVWERILGP